MIAPLKQADIDILVVLGSDYFYHYNGKNGGQAGLLDLVKRTLRETYPRTPDVSRNGQAVTIQFTDFMVDVVPAFNREGGGYLIPNSITQGWISTDPKKHEEIMSTANREHKDDLVPLIKMIKAWNRVTRNYFRSFHLEVLALHILHGVVISDYPSGVRYFFDKARDYVTKKNPDPAGYGDDVGRYLNTQEKISKAVKRFDAAYNKARMAESGHQFGYVLHATDAWRQIFGDYFPVTD
jgi:hypothetical protein